MRRLEDQRLAQEAQHKAEMARRRAEQLAKDKEREMARQRKQQFEIEKAKHDVEMQGLEGRRLKSENENIQF